LRGDGDVVGMACCLGDSLRGCEEGGIEESCVEGWLEPTGVMGRDGLAKGAVREGGEREGGDRDLDWVACWLCC
jgi:hypothetical protein